MYIHTLRYIPTPCPHTIMPAKAENGVRSGSSTPKACASKPPWLRQLILYIHIQYIYTYAHPRHTTTKLCQAWASRDSAPHSRDSAHGPQPTHTHIQTITRHTDTYASLLNLFPRNRSRLRLGAVDGQTVEYEGDIEGIYLVRGWNRNYYGRASGPVVLTVGQVDP